MSNNSGYLPGRPDIRTSTSGAVVSASADIGACHGVGDCRRKYQQCGVTAALSVVCTPLQIDPFLCCKGFFAIPSRKFISVFVVAL